MLYVSTRNKIETHTSHRALFTDNAPDGGFFAPFHLPECSIDDFGGSLEENIARILNVFFDTNLCSDDIKNAIGSDAIVVSNISQRLLFAEAFHNPAGNIRNIIENIHYLLTNQRTVPDGWVYIAIKIALLFGLFVHFKSEQDGLDVALPADDYGDLSAVLYAKKMGLPMNRIICVCNHNNRLWDLVNRGEYSLVEKMPNYLENLIYHIYGNEGVTYLLKHAQKKSAYMLNDEQVQALTNELFVAVVSNDRIDTVAANMFSSNQYRISPDAALAYAGLQDYRSKTGINKHTLIFAEQRPD
ncbi:MAG: hypothetical protein IKK11_01240 [Oscillospiraceae bacterium]|nr:hypothetical protein [Oscillospiraceae bacterium]